MAAKRDEAKQEKPQDSGAASKLPAVKHTKKTDSSSQIEKERERLLVQIDELARVLTKEKDILQVIMENTGAQLAYLDAEFNFVKVNSAYAMGSGHSVDELIGKNHFALFPSEENQVIFEQVRDTGEAVEFHDKPFTYVDQPWRGVTYWDWTLAPVKDDSGSVQGLVLSLVETTERVRTEEALRESQLLGQRIIDATPHILYLYDLIEQRNVYVNKEVWEILGYTPEDVQEMGSKLIETLVHPDDYQSEVEHIEKLARAKYADVFENEYRIKHANGEWRWLRSRDVVFTRGADGLPRQTLGTAQDITERKQAEEALRRSEDKYRNLVENLHEGIWVIDKDAYTTFVNPRMAEMLGYTVEEMLGKHLFSFMDEAAVVIATRHLQRRKRGIEERHDFEFLRKDGTNVYTSLETTPITDDNGNYVGAIAGVQDISKRRRAEEALQKARDELELRVAERTAELAKANEDLSQEIIKHKEAQEALQQSEARLRLLLEQVPCVVWTTDTELRFTSVVGAGVAGLNRLPNLVVGMTLSDYAQTSDPDFLPLIAHRRALMDMPTTYELKWTGKTLHCRVEPLRDKAGNIIGVIGAAFDITERKHGEDGLRALSHRLVEIQEKERRAIGRELHDQIGQSLTVLNLLLYKAMLSPAKNAGPSLGEAQALLVELMAQVRNLSLDLQPRILDDLGLLPALLWHFERYIAQTQVKVKFEHAGLQNHFSPEVSTAAYRIVQEALTNVARHAGVSEVIVRAWADNSTLSVRVEDQGAGFDLARLNTGNSSGLNGMRERALLLGGKLTINSAPGAGTSVTAELPLAIRSKRSKKEGRE